jgi:pyridoxine kinase
MVITIHTTNFNFIYRLLSGLTIKTEEDIKTVFEYFHSHGIPNVVITSSNIDEKEGLMKTYASSKINGVTKTFQVQFPSISASFIGTGDAFASLLLAYYHHESKNSNTDSSTDCALSRSIEKVIATMQAILQTTLEYSKVSKVTDSHPNAQLVKHDLKLIQSKKHIENPIVIHKAQPF